MRNRKVNTPTETGDKARKAMYKRGKKGTGDPNTPYYVVIGLFVVCMLVVVIYMLLNPKESLLNKQVIDENEIMVQNLQSQMFQHGANDQFVGYTMDEARRFFNIGIADSPNFPSCAKNDDVEIPDNYDFRQDEERKACVDDEPRKTGDCTAGHVLSIISAVEDRICIANNGKERFRLSAQDAVSCDHTNFNCEGGYVTHTIEYGRENGFVREECFPWEGKNVTCPAEPNKCRENKEQYQLMNYCVVQGPDSIKREIIKNGPVVAPMTPFTDFLTYKQGTYFPGEGSFKFNGQQAVKIIGWEKGMQGDVWIIENSWGPQWGEGGYARVMAGHKDLGLDYIAISPLPIPMTAAKWEKESARMQKEYEASSTQGLDNASPIDAEE